MGIEISRYVIAVALLTALLAWGCSPAADVPVSTLQSGVDTGAAARQQVISRYGADSRMASVSTPEIVGLTLSQADEVLTAQGLGLRAATGQDQVTEGGLFAGAASVPGDRRIKAQSPEAGQPVPPDGLVEGRVQRPPGAATEYGSSVAATPPAPAPAEPPPTTPASAAAPPSTPTPSTPTPVRPQPVPAPRPVLPERSIQTTDQEPTTPPEQAPETAPETASDSEGVRPGYVLPPHTPGRLRTNPRVLPAVPFGTELSGDASWYGPGFDGLQTACGGIYDQNGATIASRELRCGTIVRVTGPTGLTVQATVTDWGPAEWTGRRFDLSAAVFNAISPLGAGVISVRIITANVPD